VTLINVETFFKVQNVTVRDCWVAAGTDCCRARINSTYANRAELH